MPTAPSVMIVAGEASADQHGAALVRELRRVEPGLTCWGAGGQLMREAGFEVLVPAQELAVAGLTEVVWSLPRLWRLGRGLAAEAAKRRPAVVVLIDLPDFNLRLARRLARLGLPVVYYVSPQIWAWRQHRVQQIKKLVSTMLCILPFEQRFYEQHGVPARFVGHPLLEEIPAPLDRSSARDALAVDPEHQPVVALVPGSRPKEVARHLPVMLQALRLIQQRFPGALGIVPVASTIKRETVAALVERSQVPALIVEQQATAAIAASDVAMVCSGTATLQTALLARPMVVVYRVSWLTYEILRRLVKVPFISLVNLIAGRRLVAELVQHQLTADRLSDEVQRYLIDPEARNEVTRELHALRGSLGDGHTATQVAKAVLDHAAASLAGATAHSTPEAPSP